MAWVTPGEAGNGARQAEGGVEVEERGRAWTEGAQRDVLGVTREDLQPAAHDGGGAGCVRAARLTLLIFVAHNYSPIPDAAAG